MSNHALSLTSLLGVLLSAEPVSAQTFAGRYAFQSPQGPVALTLEQSGSQVAGVLDGANGMAGNIRSSIDDGRAIGTIDLGQATGWIAMGFQGATLIAIIAEIDPSTGQPDLDNGYRLDFTRTGAASGGSSAQAPVAEADAGSSNTPLVQQWLGHLRGKKLTYMDSYSSSDAGGSGGYSERWDAYLCSDGRFQYRSRSRMNIDAGAYGSSSGNNSFSGRWRVVEAQGQAVLQYQRDDGRVDWATLSLRGGSTYLDDMRVFVTNENDVCN